jgi:hypothetical protein
LGQVKQVKISQLVIKNPFMPVLTKNQTPEDKCSKNELHLRSLTSTIPYPISKKVSWKNERTQSAKK